MASAFLRTKEAEKRLAEYERLEKVASFLHSWQELYKLKLNKILKYKLVNINYKLVHATLSAYIISYCIIFISHFS